MIPSAVFFNKHCQQVYVTPPQSEQQYPKEGEQEKVKLEVTGFKHPKSIASVYSEKEGIVARLESPVQLVAEEGSCNSDVVRTLQALTKPPTP